MRLVMQVTDRAFSHSKNILSGWRGSCELESSCIRRLLNIHYTWKREGVIKGQDRTFDAEKRRKLEVYVPCT